MADVITERPLVSIVTVVFNGEKTIRDTIESVLSQTYPSIEFIVVDGASTDATMEVVSEYSTRISLCISEKDEGLYDALNKGVSAATGDIVGVLHSDDFYIDSQVIDKVVKEYRSHSVDAVFGDLLYVGRNDKKRILRRFTSRGFTPEKMRYGLMPAHTTFFVRRTLYEKLGNYLQGYKIAADFELMLRFIYVNKISYRYLPEPLVKMRIGGISSGGLRTRWQCNVEVLKALRSHGIKSSHITLLKKYPHKFKEVLLGRFFCDNSRYK